MLSVEAAALQAGEATGAGVPLTSPLVRFPVLAEAAETAGHAAHGQFTALSSF